MSTPTPEEKLAAVFNKDRVDNGLPIIDFSEYIFQTPTTFVGTRNTRIYAIPALSSLYVGCITIYYDRIALSTVTNLTVTKGSATKMHDLIPQLNEELGITLTAADIADGNLPASGGFTLTATSVNKLFTGNTTVAYRV